MSDHDHDGWWAEPALHEGLLALVAEAAAAIRVHTPAEVDRREKPDASPVTLADEASESILLAGLGRLVPGLPVVAEEAVARGLHVTCGDVFALVDPLDGTREFLAGHDDYTIGVALVVGGTPVVGIVAAPARGLVWSGIVGRGASRRVLGATEGLPVRTRPAPAGGLVLTESRSHPDAATAAYAARLPLAGRTVVGSALKFCLVAEGAADIYPRLQSLCEWDVAAGHALVVAAGGAVTAADGGALPYGRADTGYRLPGFVAVGDPALTLPGA